MTEDKDNGMTNSNGTPGGEGTAVTFALDEGYQFGLGVFETINLTGGRLVMLDRHLDRLRRGARALDIDAPDDDTLRAHIAEHLDAAELPDGRSFAVKLMVSSANVIVTHRPNPYADWAQDRGLRLGWCRAWRNECSPLTAHKTLNQGDNILESRSARRLGFDSAVYLNTRGDICETTNANLFFERDGRLYTPDERCGLLPGTVRAWLCERYEAEQGTFRQDSLDSWDEVFATNALMGVRPVVELGDAGYGIGPVTRAIQREYRRLELGIL